MTEPVASSESGDSGPPPDFPRHRSLSRQLLVVVLLFAVAGLTLLLYRHQQIVRWISDVEARGGRIGVYSEESGWLRDLLGERHIIAFAPAWCIDLQDATDEDLRVIVRDRNLSQVVNLTLLDPRLTAEGWEMVAGLEKLMNLEVVGDATILEDRRLVSQLDQLAMLSVRKSYLSSDELIENLTILPNLQYLTFSEIPLSDRQIEILSLLTKLKSLAITFTSLDKANVIVLQSLTEIRELDLTATDLTDDAVRELAAFTRLSDLTLFSQSHLA